MFRKLTAVTVAMVMVVSMGVSGCAVLQPIGRFFVNIVKPVMDALCTPTDAQKAQAKAAIAFIDSCLGLVAPTVQLRFIAARNVFFNLLTPGICVTYAQLAEAVKVFDQAAVVANAKAKATLGAEAGVVVPNIDALRVPVPDIDALRAKKATK